MRILRVAQKCYPDVTGGGAYHVHALSRDQAARGHDVTVLTVATDDGQPRREERDGYTVVRCEPTTELLGNTISAGVARFLWRADEFDVIHAHSHLYFSTNLAALAHHVTETPLAITNHGLYSQTAPEWLFDAYVQTAGRLTFDSADVVFCYTDADRDRLWDVGVETEIAVVPNGIDQTRFTPDGEVSERLPTGGPTVLFVGRFVEGKCPRDALEAFVRVRTGWDDDGPAPDLAFVGDGPLRDDLETLARNEGVADAVTFLGHVPYDEMPQVYRGVDLLVLPSRAEGLPRTVLEALSSGVPVVTSDLPQVREVSEEAGLVAPVGDVPALADAMAELLGDEERRRELGDRGRELVDERFTWEGTVEQTTAHLQRLVDRR